MVLVSSMHTILIVEDDSFINTTYHAKLTQEGFTSVQATTVQKAREALKAQTVDFILLDIMLPDESGLTFLKELKEDEKSKGIPVMVLSNMDTEETMEQARKLGAVEYMVKASKSPADIVQKIREYLQ